MAQKKQPFTLTVTHTAEAGSNDLAMHPVEENILYCVQHLAVENETTDFTSIRVLVKERGDELLLEEQLDPEGGLVYWMTDNVYLTPGQRLTARLAGCTAGDALRLYLRGWRQEGVMLDA